MTKEVVLVLECLMNSKSYPIHFFVLLLLYFFLLTFFLLSTFLARFSTFDYGHSTQPGVLYGLSNNKIKLVKKGGGLNTSKVLE
jgi:hypothetical protein